MNFRIMKTPLYLGRILGVLLNFYSGVVCADNPDGTAFVGELTEQVEKQRKILDDMANDPQQLQRMQTAVDQLSGFFKQRNALVADPKQYEDLAKEISLGGVGIEGDNLMSQATKGVPELMDKHFQLLSSKEFEATMTTAVVPLSRWITDSNQCNLDGWPASYYCSDCIESHFGLCVKWGVTPATVYRVPTQINAVSRDSDSSPWTLGVTREVSAQFKTGEIFPGMENLTGGISKQIANKAVELLKTIEFKRLCVERSLTNQVMQIAASTALGVVSGAPVKPALDVKDEILACIKNAAVSMALIPNKDKFDLAVREGKLSPELAKRLQRNLTNEIVSSTEAQTTYNYSVTPHFIGRRLTKELQDNKVTYPNIRIEISLYGGIEVKWVFDPAIIHFVKPPYDVPETNLKKVFAPEDDHNPEGDFLGIEGGKQQIALNQVGDVITDAVDPFNMFQQAVLPDISGLQFDQTKQLVSNNKKINFFKHIFDSAHFFPLLPKPFNKLPFSEDFKKNLIVRAIDPRYVGDIWRSIQHVKNPFTCSNPMLSQKWKAMKGYGSSEIKEALQVAQKLAMLEGLGAPTAKFAQGAKRGINKILAEYNKDVGTFSQLCSDIAGPMGAKAGSAVSTQTMASITKAFKVELKDIENAGKRAITVRRPPRNPGELALMQDDTLASNDNPMLKRVFYPFTSIVPAITNITLYEYKEEAKGDWGDRAQYLGLDLEKLKAPFAFNYSKQCRKADRPDYTAESQVFPGNEAKTYIVNTAFAGCPEYSPLGSGSFLGFLIDLAIKFIPGSQGGLKDFDERWY